MVNGEEASMCSEVLPLLGEGQEMIQLKCVGLEDEGRLKVFGVNLRSSLGEGLVQLVN